MEFREMIKRSDFVDFIHEHERRSGKPLTNTAKLTYSEVWWLAQKYDVDSICADHDASCRRVKPVLHRRNENRYTTDKAKFWETLISNSFRSNKAWQ